MRQNSFSKITWMVASLAAVIPLFAAEPGVEERLRELEAQNKRLLEALNEQQELIQKLQGKMSSLEGEDVESADNADESNFKFGNIHFSGQGALGYFHTGAEGSYPDGAFNVDEAKLFVETPLWKDTYFFTELDLIIREADDEFAKLGELYVDFENVSRFFGRDRLLNIRVGRVDIPFGEEYLVRDAIDNPLISHSLSDLWGVDEGIELYGSVGRFSYVVAVQNGGHPMLNDFDADKSVAGRINYDPANWLHLSLSGMRTGDLDPAGDELSEVWFGNGFFRSIGPEATTTRFEASMFELDAHTYWQTGHLKLAGGYVQYGDDDSARDQERDAWYYYAEAKQDLFAKLYGAARFSQIIADKGMPLVGHGDFGDFLFGPLTTNLWRLSLGVGYQWSDNLVAKLEYTFERGELLSGASRNKQDFVGAQLGFQF